MTESDLLQAIFNAPDDDGPRLAWADHLEGLGNPWADVVRKAVALAQKRKSASRELLALEQEHAAKGLGPLAKVASRAGLRFHRGLPVGLAVGHDIWETEVVQYFGTPPYFSCEPVVPPKDPRWRGIEWLHNVAGDGVLTLLEHAPLDRLTTLRNVSASAVAKIAVLPFATGLQTFGVYAYDRDASKLEPGLLRSFPQLQRLQLSLLVSANRKDAAFDWLDADSCPTVQWLKFLPLTQLDRIARAMHRWSSLQGVCFEANVQLVRQHDGLELFLGKISPFVEQAVRKLPHALIRDLQSDQKVLLSRKNGSQVFDRLCAELGAHGTIHLKPTAKKRHTAMWDW